MDLAQLVERLGQLHRTFGDQAFRAVNVCLTGRNWLVGCHIKEYELKGSDRARYGVQLYRTLAERLIARVDVCYTARYLRLCRQFYEGYPQIGKSLISQFEALAPTAKSLISQSGVLPPTARALVSRSSSPQNAPSADGSVPGLDPGTLLASISFTHFLELMKLEPSLKRAFYEIECVRGTWSVRELKRQIASLYYERSGLSDDKQKLADMAAAQAEETTAAASIRDPYVFEFLGLRAEQVMTESRLEHALLGKLEHFLLELGRGFCFEGRQRRVLIGDEHFFVDLVFYHRILKCHILLELKNDGFSHEHLGQLNTYVSWYREHEMTPGDNPPIGILLCTERNRTLVKYALAGLNSQLFVSKYQLQLPDEVEMRAFVEAQLKEKLAAGETR